MPHNNSMMKTSSTRLMIAASTALFLYGAIASMLGTLLPDLSTRFHMTPKENGHLASVQALGLMLASIVAGPLIDNRGKKTGFLAGMMLIVLSLFGLPNSEGWKTLTACMFVLGLGGGTIVTAANTLVSDLGKDQRASMLSLANVFFGLGGLLTPFIAANLVHGNAIALSYVIAVLAAVILVLHASTPMPAAVVQEGFEFSRVLELPDKSLLLLLSFFVFLYVACEVAFWNWLTRYLAGEGISQPVALNILALGFASGMLIGRLVSSSLLVKYSAVSVSFVCSCLMVITTYWALHTTSPAIAGLSVFCAGAAMGPVYPSAMGMVGDAFRQMTATFMGIAITSGWIGVVASSWLIGSLAGNDGNHLRMALLILPVFSAAMIVINVSMRPMLAKARARSEMVYDAPARNIT